MSAADFAPVLVTARSDRARQVVWTGRGPVLLENRDLLTTVWLGQDEGMDPGGSDVTPLDPLGSKSLDGTRDVWAMTQAGSAVVASVPGGTGSQVSPLLIAQQLTAAGLATAANQVEQNTAIPDGIATTGTPLLHGFDYIQGPNQVLTVGPSSSQFGGGFFGKNAYVISISVSTTGNMAFPFCELLMLWQDAGGIVPMAQESWFIPCCTAGQYIIVGKGPVKGPHLSMKITNFDAAQTITATYTILESTHPIARDDLRGPIGSAVAGVVPNYTQPPGSDITFGHFALFNQTSIPANTTVSYLLPMFSGQMWFTYSQITASALKVTLLPVNGTPGDDVIWSESPPTFPAVLNHQFVLPRMNVVMNVQNTTGAAALFNFNGIMLELVS